MTMEALRRAGMHPENQRPEQQKAINLARQVLVDFGVKDPGPKVENLVSPEINELQPTTPEAVKIYPEISLEAEWSRQAQNLARLFAEELGLTPETYMATLPQFESQPEEWKGRMDTPVIFETRITPDRQAELAGINYFLIGLGKADWNASIKGYETPNVPYSAWLDDGRNHMGKSVKGVRKKLRADELAGTELEGVGLFISNPKILQHHFLDLPGTTVRSGFAANLDLWSGGPRVRYFFVGHANPGFGSVVRGRKK